MTEQQKKNLARAKMALTRITIGSRHRQALEQVLSDWQDADAKIECVKETIENGLPLLDLAFERYGCKRKDACHTSKCPQSWPCAAEHIRKVTEGLRSCLAGGLT